MRDSWILAVALIVVVLAVGLFYVGPSGTLHTMPVEAVKDHSGGALLARREWPVDNAVPAASREEAAGTAEQWQVVALDSHERPIGGVAVYSVKELAPNFLPEDLIFQGVTSVDGTVQVLPGSFAGVIGYAEGYVPGVCSSAAAAGGRLRLLMNNAGVLSVRCATSDGIPVDGVRLAVGMSNSRPGSVVCPFPGGDPTSAIHRQVSNSDGRATFTQIPRNRVVVSASHRSFVPVHYEGGPFRDLSHSPMGIEITLDPLVGMLFVVVDRQGSIDVVDWRLDTPRGLRIQSVSHDEVLRLQRELARDRRANCFLLSEKYDSARGYGWWSPDSTIRLLTRAHGWFSVKVPLRPVDALVEPDVIDVSAIATSPTRDVVLEVHSPDGIVASDQVFRLVSADDDRPTQLTDLSGKCVLQPGSYRVSVLSPFVARAVTPSPVDVVAGSGFQRIVLSARHRVRPLEVIVRDVHDIDGVMPDGALFLASEGVPVSALGISNGRCVEWVTDAIVRVTADVVGYQRATAVWDGTVTSEARPQLTIHMVRIP